MAATEDFATFAATLDSPLVHLALVTTNDTTDLTDVSRVVYITVAGALKVTTLGGETITIPSGTLSVGVPHKLRVTRIFATGTTATGIMVGW